MGIHDWTAGPNTGPKDRAGKVEPKGLGHGKSRIHVACRAFLLTKCSKAVNVASK